MKKSFIFVLALALAATASCSKEAEIPQPDRQITITACADDETRTAVVDGGTTVYWQPGDEITVFRMTDDESAWLYGKKFTTDITSLAKVADFTGTEPDGTGEFRAIYPATVDQYHGGMMMQNLPYVQRAVAGTFDKGLWIAVGHSETTQMSFHPACGGFRFTLSQTGIRWIKFEAVAGETLAGDIGVGFENDEPAILYTGGTHSNIVLFPPEGEETFQTGVWYYIVAIPGELSHGYYLSFYKDGTWARLVRTDPITIKRGVIGYRENVDAGLTFQEHEYVDLGLPSGTLWATYNVGALEAGEYGDHFAWGETRPKVIYNWATYKWCNSGNDHFMTRYNDAPAWGTVDNKTLFSEYNYEDDAAHVLWGGKWRMPTKAEMEELCSNCYATQVGHWNSILKKNIPCMLLYGPGPDPENVNTITIPFAGYSWGNRIIMNDASVGEKYWVSYYMTGEGSVQGKFWCMYMYPPNNTPVRQSNREIGNSVRAVYDPTL